MFARPRQTLLKHLQRRFFSSFPVVHPTQKVPIYIYSKIEQEELIDQLVSLANSGIAEHYISVMPDVHLGKGATVGTVFASSNFVSPNAVGVDIGCGMCAVPVDGLYTSNKGPNRRKVLTADQKDQIFRLIKADIPTGFNSYDNPLSETNQIMEKITENQPPTKYLKDAINKKAACQLGTLGGGNHFLEVDEDETEQVWLMLHSGSRGIGNNTAEYYNKIAMSQMEKQGIVKKAKADDLNYLRIDSGEGQSYLKDMEWCQSYAYHNRQAMMDRMIRIINKVVGITVDTSKSINIHHNYCTCETCKVYDPKNPKNLKEQQLWITRKGATSAKLGEYGIIPGSMGVGSFIVRGLGNPQSWQSCSHGAGRQLSRIKAKSQISQKDFENSMVGIVCDTDERLRDEAPQAYKDLNEVMRNQESLVEIVHKLRPLINVKGFK